VDLLARRVYLARIAGISPAAYIENAFELMRVIASHHDDGLDDAVAGTAELGSARQSLSALALISLPDRMPSELRGNIGASVNREVSALVHHYSPF